GSSAGPSTGCSPTSGRGAAGCWWCAARRASARPRCWATRPRRRKISGWCGRRASSRRWSCRSRRCPTPAAGCRPGWTGRRARRLDAESVALLFGTRDPAAASDLAGLPGLAVEGLPDADARALLASVVPGRLDERVRDRIIAESGGNPLALLELPRGATLAAL